MKRLIVAAIGSLAMIAASLAQNALIARHSPTILAIFAVWALATCQLAIAQQEPTVANEPDTLVQQLADPQISDAVFKLRILHLTKEELADLASQWLQKTRATVKEAADANILVSTATGQVDASTRSRLEAKLRERNLLLRKFDLILDEWTAKGATDEEVGGYRQYATAVLQTELRSTDLTTLFNFFRQWIVSPDGGLRLLYWLILVIGSLFILNLLALAMSAGFRRSLAKRRRVSTLLRNFLSRTAYWVIFAIGTALILSSIGFNLTPVIAAFGGASFIIGFATQSTLSNLASGLLLMVSRPFDVGDHVNVAGVSGKVESVTTISTVIRSADNRTTIVPNTKVWDSVIVNEDRSGQVEH